MSDWIGEAALEILDLFGTSPITAHEVEMVIQKHSGVKELKKQLCLLQEMHAGACERIAAQAELLSRRACWREDRHLGECPVTAERTSVQSGNSPEDRT